MKKKNNRYKKNMTGLKYLMASFSIVASIALWAIFSTSDQVAQVMNASEENAGSVVQNNGFVIDALPTLVPLEFGNGQAESLQVPQQEVLQELRSVSAPQVIVQAPSKPVIVVGASGTQQNTQTGSRASTTNSTTKSSG
jgi:hypothetical protein